MEVQTMSSSKGSTGNVIAAIASLVFPGLGQLVQGRIFAALFYFVLGGAIHIFTLGLLGWIGHLVAAIDAAVYRSD